jgi:SAM-dependent methyltransferase
VERDERPFWERPEVVERFAGREPDLRLVAWLDARGDATGLRVLDLGCAGGRNAELLARRGCDILAIDSSEAMVRRTRARVAGVLGAREAERRVRVGRMESLHEIPDGSVDLVVALGVYHNATTRPEFDRAVAETARVLRPGGELLAASFAPGTVVDGSRLEPVPGEPSVFAGGEAGRRHVLLSADDLDAELALHGLDPATPTATAMAESGGHRRVTVNGLYRRRA